MRVTLWYVCPYVVGGTRPNLTTVVGLSLSAGMADGTFAPRLRCHAPSSGRAKLVSEHQPPLYECLS